MPNRYQLIHRVTADATGKNDTKADSTYRTFGAAPTGMLT